MQNALAFGAVLRDRREDLGRTQEAVNEAGGPVRQVLSDIEQGKPVDISVATLRKLDAGLELPKGFARALLQTANAPIDATGCEAGESDQPGIRALLSAFCLRPGGAEPMLGMDLFHGGGGVPWPSALIVNTHGARPIRPALLRLGHLLIDVNVAQHLADTGQVESFAVQWERGLPGAFMGTTTLRAVMRPVFIDPFDVVGRLSDARGLLQLMSAKLGHHAGGALATAFAAFAALRLGVSGVDVIATFREQDRSRFSLNRLDGSEPLNVDGIPGDREGVDVLAIGAYSWSDFVEDLAVLRAQFIQRFGAGLELDFGAADAALRRLVSIRSEATDVVLPERFDPEERYELSTVPADRLPIGDLVGRRDPTLLVYDRHLFPELPAMLTWAASVLAVDADFVTVTQAGEGEGSSGSVVEVSTGRGDFDIALNVGEGQVALTHFQPALVEGEVVGWVGVLTDMRHEIRCSTAVFIPAA